MMVRQAGRGERGALITSLAVYFLLFALKLAVFFASGIMVMLAEALHSFSDIIVTSFLLGALIWSRRPADHIHVLGHGRAQNIAALVAATLFISFTSYKLFEEAIPRLFSAQPSSYENTTLATWVIIFSMVVSLVPLLRLLLQQGKGAAAKAQFTECINDEVALVGALAGILFLAHGVPIADPIATILVACVIAANAVWIFRENFHILVGRAPAEETVNHITNLALSVNGVLGVHGLRVTYIGPDTLHADIHIDVRADMPVIEADKIAEEVRSLVHQRTGCRYCEVHVDPAIGESSDHYHGDEEIDL
jgi:cation diffusion facilitator family transporter